MGFCHFLFFLVKNEHKKDVKCKAFITTKLELKKVRKLQYEICKIFRKIVKYTNVLSIFLVPPIVKELRNVRGREKACAVTNICVISSQ